MDTRAHMTEAQAHARAWSLSRLASGPVFVVLAGTEIAVVANDELDALYPEGRAAVIVGTYERGRAYKAAA